MGSTWVILPERNAAFIGDTVTPGQPPFIAHADLDAWLDALHELSLARFKNFVLISGRGGMINQEDIRDQQKFLRKIKRRLEKLSSSKVNLSKVEEIGRGYADDFKANSKKDAKVFRNRLAYGFVQYLTNQYPGQKRS